MKTQTSERMSNSRTSCASDMWSAGILMATLLNKGLHPIDDGTKQPAEIKRAIIKGELNLGRIKCSDSAKQLLQSLLQTNPNQRIDIESALCHPWVKNLNVGVPLGLEQIESISKNEHRLAAIFRGLAMVHLLRNKCASHIAQPETKRVSASGSPTDHISIKKQLMSVNLLRQHSPDNPVHGSGTGRIALRRTHERSSPLKLQSVWGGETTWRSKVVSPLSPLRKKHREDSLTGHRSVHERLSNLVPRLAK